MRSIAVLVDDIYEDLELWYPRLRLEEEGWKVRIAGPEAGKRYTGKHGYPCTAELAYAQLRAEDFDALIVPGGFAPDRMRRDPSVLAFVRAMDDAGKLVAFICHAGWVLISAGILRGRKATSTAGIRDDMVNAGTLWVDEPLVVDGNLLSSRTPADLPAFAKGIVDWLGIQQNARV
jgi:protease I